jgi:hypothetical protein
LGLPESWMRIVGFRPKIELQRPKIQKSKNPNPNFSRTQHFAKKSTVDFDLQEFHAIQSAQHEFRPDFTSFLLLFFLNFIFIYFFILQYFNLGTVDRKKEYNHFNICKSSVVRTTFCKFFYS